MGKELIDEQMKHLLEVDFFYEIKRMVLDINLFRIWNPLERDKMKIRVPEDVLIDYLTHIRNLFEFFHTKGNLSKGIASAKHYLADWDCNEFKERVSSEVGKISIFLSHLSYNRSRGNPEFWDVFFLYEHFKSLILAFLNRLKKSGFDLSDGLNKLIVAL